MDVSRLLGVVGTGTSTVGDRPVTPTLPCTHGMPSPASCIVCMDDGNIALPPERTTLLHPAGPAFTARHQGRCARCDELIEPGETIRRWDDDLYRHEDCG